ncbi:MAG: glycosyltransferase, partial [Candidatus Asgardarchaeia archaeon]
MDVSIGICAYNEEKNIGKIINALLKQRIHVAKIKEIIIVSSGSTDNTNIIVNAYAKKYDKVKLFIQKKREGKASAINIFLKNAIGEILVLESADTIPLPNTIENLVLPFIDQKIGMTGGRPIPVNDKRTILGYTIHLLWTLHHLISISHPENPKFGEIIAFRKGIVKRVPKKTVVDEAWIQAMVAKKGFKFKYVPSAIVLNKGPETVSDFLRQRRRI